MSELVVFENTFPTFQMESCLVSFFSKYPFSNNNDGYFLTIEIDFYRYLDICFEDGNLIFLENIFKKDRIQLDCF